MSKPKKRDSIPLYVPKGKISGTNSRETRTQTVSGDDLVDGISDLSLTPTKPKKVSKKAGTENGKVLPIKTEVPDSWENITDDEVGNVSIKSIVN